MKFGQLAEYNIRNIFLENHTQNESEMLYPDAFCFFKMEHISGSII